MRRLFLGFSQIILILKPIPARDFKNAGGGGQALCLCRRKEKTVMAKTMLERGAGLLMPISSLPSPYGIGTFGKSAYEFVDMLKKPGAEILAGAAGGAHKL